jgi:hypothetical protein
VAAKPHFHLNGGSNMDLHFLDGSAPELKSWLTDRGGYLFEERPEAVYRATTGLRAAYGDDGTDSEQFWH